MNPQMNPSRKVSFLDITEFILKERSPLIRPAPAPFETPVDNMKMTLELSPAFESKMPCMITPVFETKRKPSFDILKDSSLSDLDNFQLEPNYDQTSTKRKKKNSTRPRLDSSIWHLEDQELENILEQESFQSSEEESSESLEDRQHYSEQLQSEDYLQKDEDLQEKHQTSPYGQGLKTEIYSRWESKNPKRDIIHILKGLMEQDDGNSQELKIEMIREKLGEYFFDHEKFYFEECFNHGKGTLKNMVNAAIKEVERIFKKNIGGLSFQKRRLKILRYLEKKKFRTWTKKVNYDCRKQVADSRLRIKGKFVTQEQALEQLGLETLEGYTPNSLKQFLQKRIKP